MTSCPKTLAIGLALCLSACALDPNGSYVAQVERPEDVAILASGITMFIAAKLPAASTTIVLDATPADQTGNSLTPALAGALRRAGFAVADPTQAMSGIGHHLKYLVTPLDSGSLVRLVLDDRTAASRFFARSPSGELQAGGPFTVTQANASS